MRLRSLTSKYAGVIEVFDDAIPNTREIISYLERNAEWGVARVGSADGEVNTETRNNAVTFIDQYSLLCAPILRDFAATVFRYLDDYGRRYDVSFSAMEHVNINRYGPGEQYHAHADAGPGQNREISALVYLNDVAEGGHTEFIHHGISVAPKAGRLVIFPSNYAYAHAAHPPVSGTKYSAAFWTVR